MKWLSRLVLVIAIVASVVAALLFAAGFVYDAHSPIFGVKIPTEYRQWELAAVSHEAGPDELRGVVASPLAIMAYRRGTLRFQDGAMPARLVDSKPDVDEADYRAYLPCRQANIKGHDFVFACYAP
jgi:hypothetical protein